mgnify:CR=1 FL=1
MATLKVTHTEDITINGQQHGSVSEKSIADIVDVYKRTVTCTASQTTTIAVFGDTVHSAACAVDEDSVKYIRITNLDASNSVELAVVGDATLYQVTLAAEESHVLGASAALMLAEADTSPSFGTMADIASLQVNPGSNAVKIEVFIASATPA